MGGIRKKKEQLEEITHTYYEYTYVRTYISRSSTNTTARPAKPYIELLADNPSKKRKKKEESSVGRSVGQP